MAKQTGKRAATGKAKATGKVKTAGNAPGRVVRTRPVSLRVLFWVTALILLVDQASKYYVVHTLRLDRIRAIDVLPPWFNLRMAWNQGMNFGLFSSSQDLTRWALIAIALAVSLFIFLWIRRTRPGWFAQMSAGLLIGGALGNVIDRLTYGAVADFLNMSLPWWENPYSFNVADISIFAGVIGLILQPPEPAATARDKTRDAPGKSG